jgi:GT2 family glycosyltransferase
MISVVIPTYKNQSEFLKKLKNNLPYLENCEIVIVNDNPEESLKHELKQFQNIILLENKKNLGFGQTVNRGVAKAKGELIMLLNDDVIFHNESFLNAIKYFKENPQLFAVSFAQKEKDGSIVGKNKTFWRNGLFFHQKADDLTFGDNDWAEGGACLVDKQKFQQLGGFDPIYSPFYWEDIDLSYRAKKAGYKIFFDPNITVDHHHESTIGKYFSKDYVKTIAFRNQFLFIWKNIHGEKIVSHFLFLPFNLVYYIFKGEIAFVKGFFAAIKIYLFGQ